MIISILSFAFGIGSVQQLPALPDPKVFLFMAVVLVVSLWLRCRTCLWFLAGFCWAAIFAYIGLADRLPESLEGKVIELSGHVIGIPSNYEQRVRFDLAVQPSNEHLPSKIRLNWYYPTHEVKAGQYWRLSVKLKRPSGSLNPGTFDYERWLFGQGIGATGYVRPNPEPVLLNADAAWFDVSAWRQTLADVLDRHLSTLPNRGVIKALTIGDRQDVESGEWDLLR
ncbi:MAG: ComEC/Rec2 family competence protein, partial [Gammaproteobacteria bacterium]